MPAKRVLFKKGVISGEPFRGQEVNVVHFEGIVENGAHFGAVFKGSAPPNVFSSRNPLLFTGRFATDEAIQQLVRQLISSGTYCIACRNIALDKPQFVVYRVCSPCYPALATGEKFPAFRFTR